MDDWKSFINETTGYHVGDLVLYRSPASIDCVTADRSMFVGVVVSEESVVFSEESSERYTQYYIVRWHRLTDGLVPRTTFDITDSYSRRAIVHSIEDLILLATKSDVEKLTGVCL